MRQAVRRERGFTLLEVVVKLLITAIIAGSVAAFLTAPVDAYFDQSGRALLNDSSETISRRLADDLGRALPNSVRIRNAGSRSIVEMLRVESVVFYHWPGELSDASRELDGSLADANFAVFGSLDTASLAG